MSHGSLQHVSSRLVGVVTVLEYGCISLNNEQKILPVCQIMPWQELICHFTALKVPVYDLVELQCMYHALPTFLHDDKT